MSPLSRTAPRPKTASHSSRSRHVDIVSGSFGAGHDAAAALIAEQLHRRGFSTRTWDVVDLMPGQVGRMMRSSYLKQIQAMPATWRWTLSAIERHDSVTSVIRRALRSTESALLAIAAERPERFVSTHPFPSQVLGQLRASGRLTVPVTTYLTDMSVHRLWVHPAVDCHLAVHDIPARQARALGAGPTFAVNPAVRSDLGLLSRGQVSQLRARTSLGLLTCPRRALALVTGGSHGIGRMFETAIELDATGLVSPVVLCGRNSRLLSRVEQHPRMRGLGWVTDMPGLLSAVDVVVQNSGGMTSIEAHAAGVPMVTYRPIAGHGESNAAALEAAGLAPWPHSLPELHRALLEALDGQDGTVPGVGLRANAPDVVDLLLPSPALIA